MASYWITLAVDVSDDDDARDTAAFLADECGARVVGVTPEPPQGSIVVGDFWDSEDGT